MSSIIDLILIMSFSSYWSLYSKLLTSFRESIAFHIFVISFLQSERRVSLQGCYLGGCFSKVLVAAEWRDGYSIGLERTTLLVGV